MEELFQRVQQDPDVKISQEDIETWVEEIGKKDIHYLENKTSQLLQYEIDVAIQDYSDELREKWKSSLLMYRVVHDLQELTLGTHTRWIQTKNDKYKLANGGYLVKTEFKKNGTYLTCGHGSRWSRGYMQYEMDKTITFQKLTPEEWVLVMANDFSNR